MQVLSNGFKHQTTTDWLFSLTPDAMAVDDRISSHTPSYATSSHSSSPTLWRLLASLLPRCRSDLLPPTRDFSHKQRLGKGRAGADWSGFAFHAKKNLVELLFWVKQCHLHNLIHLNPLLPICPDCSKCPNPVTSPCISAPLHSRPRWLSDLLAPDRAQNISPKLRFSPKKA